MRLYEVALQRSRNCPLSLSLYRCPERLVDAIIPHAHKIVGLEVLVKGVDAPAVSRFLAATMPLLECLKVAPWKALWEYSIRTLEHPYSLLRPFYPSLPSAADLRHLHTLSIPAQHFTPHVAIPSLRDVQLVSC